MFAQFNVTPENGVIYQNINVELVNCFGDTKPRESLISFITLYYLTYARILYSD